ncbi:WD40-repeat-containing domain protein, partial [Crucibulum laeve]
IIAILDKLGYVSGSEFNREDREGCLEGTRVMLLADILMWATDSVSPHVFWLNGMAGTGKTTVTETFCSILHKKELLGASFFCSRRKGRVDIHQIFPSLARALAHRYPSFEEALTKNLKQDIDPVGMNLQEQYQTLILQPAQIAFKGSPESIILCVDALDECENAEETTEKFLKAILENVLPAPLKLFLAGRPEIALRDSITSASGSQILRLHDIADHIIEADIELYLNKQLHNVKKLRETYTPWPPSELTAILKRAGKLFIYASTACKYISNKKGDPSHRLKELAFSTQPLAVKGVDELYTTILNNAFEDLDEKEQQQIQSCLSAIICSRTPITSAICSKLLSITSDDVMRALISVHAVLQVPENENENDRITMYHASFFDFVTSKSKSITKPWFIDITRGHSVLAENCLSIMNKELCFNIAGATTSYQSNDEQDLKISPHLVYVCTTWGDHLLLSIDWNQQLPEKLIQITEDILEQKFLYWLEVLSVNKMVKYGSRILYKLSKTLIVSQKIRDIANQFSQFVHAFSDQIEESTPHIYISALPFSMQNSMIMKLYSKEFPSILQIEGLNTQNALWQCKLDSAINSASFSQDGKYIVFGSDDKAIQVWNVETGEVVGDPIQGHTGPVRSVSFSPDGKYIVSGSSDKTVRVWKVGTGEAVGNPIHGHTDWVRSVSFSSDGKYIVSGSDDKTVQVWNMETGEAVGNPIWGHADWVTSVSFSPDGKYIVSGSYDQTVQVWNVETGEAVGNPIQGHTGPVTSVSFSPGGKYIVSGSDDKTVQVWNVETGEVVGNPIQGHTGSVTSVSFSPDGRYIVCGSHDKTVQIWHVETGKAVGNPIQGHTGPVRSVSFSPDGKYIVSGSRDKTVRVWNMETGGTVGDPVQGHTDWVTSVSFSPDGKHVVSGSNDKIVHVWNVETSEAVGKSIQGHTGPVTSVSFSPDGKYIVSGSEDKTVQVWSVETGEAVGNPIQGHTSSVKSVSFSPDGKYIVSGSDDQTIRVWNVETSEAVRNPIQGHTDWVTSVSFSPDGKYIVSGSDDKTIRVWNVESGEAMGNPFQGYTGPVTSVSFSLDGKYIVSGSDDQTIQVWNVETGEVVGNSIQRHTGPIASVSFSPDGRYIVSGSDDKMIHVWNVESSEAVGNPIQGHTDRVTSVSFSPDGKYIVSGSDDKTVRLWNV